MINLDFYDRDMVEPKPKVFHAFDTSIAVMTPPKNASSYIQLYHGVGKKDWDEDTYQLKFAVKRDPIDRWCGSVNQQKSRMRRHEEWASDIPYWDRDPNDIIDDHLPEDSPIRQISEFCGQYDWAGEPISAYDEVFYLHQITDELLPLLGLHDNNDPTGNNYKNRTVDKLDDYVVIGDLTDATKDKIMCIYENDYQNGWK